MSNVNAFVRWLDLWEVQGSSGSEMTNEGPVEGYCETEAEAEIYAVGKGWYGGKGNIVRRRAVEINGQVFVLMDPEPIELTKERAKRLVDEDKVKREALKKLAGHEIELLGLKELSDKLKNQKKAQTKA
jgi:hypothetical protein